MSKPAASPKKRPSSLVEYFSRPSSSASAAAAHSTSPQKSTAAAGKPVASPLSKKSKRETPSSSPAGALSAVDESLDDPFAFDPAPPTAPLAAAPQLLEKKKSSSSKSVSRQSSVIPIDVGDEDEIDLTQSVPAAAQTTRSPIRASSILSTNAVAAAAASPARTPSRTSSLLTPAAVKRESSDVSAASARKSAAAAAKAATESREKEARAIEAQRMMEREARERQRERELAPPPATPAASSARASAATSTKKKPAVSRKRKGDEAQKAAADLAAKISDDVDHVMAKVMALRASIVSESARYDRGEKRLALADLNLPNVKTEVLNLSADEVRATIERVVVMCTRSIVAGQGFQYEVPVRSSANQLYVPELDRIVLKDRLAERMFASLKNGRKTAITTRIMSLIYELCLKRIHVTKRDLFYTDVKLFEKQADSDDVIEDVACMLGCTRTSLNVVASEKGIVVGCISFKDDGDFIDCMKMGVGGKAIPPSIDRITEIGGAAKFILLVEKDAAFMRLAEDRFYLNYPCAIITAKGQPDVATRLFLKKVKETLRIPVLGLVDADPYGLKILSVYMSGSKNMSYDSASLTTPDIKWLGVRPSDLDRYKLPQQVRLPMTEHDIKTGKELLEEEFIQKNPEWVRELQLMVSSKEKAEIQALSSFGFQYLSKVYLPLKLQEGRWI